MQAEPFSYDAEEVFKEIAFFVKIYVDVRKPKGPNRYSPQNQKLVEILVDV